MDANRPFEKYVKYIESQGRRAKERGARGEAPDPTVTISRETGAGARTFAVSLADYLNETSRGEPEWMVFDKNLIGEVLRDHGLPQNLAAYMEEDRPNQVRDAVGDMLGMHPPNWELVKFTGETIVRLAQTGRCIIVGRGASVVTRDVPNVFHLRLVGSLEGRIERARRYYDVTESEASDLVRRQDRARRRYLLAYYDVDIEDPKNYHMVINVDRFTPAALVYHVARFVTHWGAEPSTREA